MFLWFWSSRSKREARPNPESEVWTEITTVAYIRVYTSGLPFLVIFKIFLEIFFPAKSVLDKSSTMCYNCSVNNKGYICLKNIESHLKKL